MRVIAGSAGGIRLTAPKTDLRPTMDRVKAAMFSALADRVPDARVLDLFAGTGALGIEALSRGAHSALFVEQQRPAAHAIEQNFIRTKVRGTVRVQDVFAFLDAARGEHLYDIILADPPYEKAPDGREYTSALLSHPTLPQLIDPDGIFVLEKHPGEELAATPLWNVTRARRYGATELLFLQLPDPAPEPAG